MSKCSGEIKLIGTVSVGPKGQVVLPKEVREKLQIEPGDSMTILLKDDKYVGVIKNDDISELMEYITNNK